MGYMLRQQITTKGALEAVPTWRYKLPSVGKFTAFELIVDCNRFAERADADLIYPLESQISKIEVVEGGSRAILSLTGSQLDAMNYWDFQQPTARRHSEQTGSDNLIHLFILAGRGLYDTKYGFDMTRLGETYLEYSHALSADAAEKFDVSSHTVYLYGWRWMGDGTPNFDGYFRTRQLAYWTTNAAATIHAVELPLGNPYRRIGVQAKTRACTLGGAIDKLELSVNNGEFSPATVESMMHWCYQEVGEYHLRNHITGLDYLVGTDATDLPSWFSYGGSLQVTQRDAADMTTIRVRPWENPMNMKAAATGNIPVAFDMTGYGFQKCLRIGFDHLEDGTDLFPTRGLGSFDLLVTEEAADKAVAVFAQDVLSY